MDTSELRFIRATGTVDVDGEPADAIELIDGRVIVLNGRTLVLFEDLDSVMAPDEDEDADERLLFRCRSKSRSRRRRSDCGHPDAPHFCFRSGTHMPASSWRSSDAEALAPEIRARIEKLGRTHYERTRWLPYQLLQFPAEFHAGLLDEFARLLGTVTRGRGEHAVLPPASEAHALRSQSCVQRRGGRFYCEAFCRAMQRTCRRGLRTVNRISASERVRPREGVASAQDRGAHHCRSGSR